MNRWNNSKSGGQHVLGYGVNLSPRSLNYLDIVTLLCYAGFSLEIKVGKLSNRAYMGKTKPLSERIRSL
jgi:hypothetical protein